MERMLHLFMMTGGAVNRGVYLIPQLAGVFGGDGVQLSWGQQGTILYYKCEQTHP